MLPTGRSSMPNGPAEFPRPYVKWSVSRTARRTCRRDRRGLSHGDDAADRALLRLGPGRRWDRPCRRSRPSRPGHEIAATGTLDGAAKCALGRRRPAIVVGGAGGARQGMGRDIALAEGHQAPVWVAPMSARNAFPEDHRLFAGFLVADRAAIVEALAGHDLIVVLGAPAFTYHVEGGGPSSRRARRSFQITDDPTVARGRRRRNADPRQRPRGGGAAAGGPGAPRAAPKLAAAAGSAAGRTADRCVAGARSPPCVRAEASSSKRHHPAESNARLPAHRREHRFHTCASGGLGHGLPAAVGVALGQRGREVIAVIGDGSAMYHPGAVVRRELGLPMTS